MLFIIGLIASGLIFGLLGRLLVPGPDPMGLGATILLGIGGSFVGGFLGRLLLNDESPGLILSALGAALLVLLARRLRRARAS